MTQFDEYIQTITEGLGEMGQGGLSSGGVKPAVTKTAGNAVQPNTTGGSVQMKHSTGTNGVAATPQVGQAAQGNQNLANEIIGLHKTNPDQFQERLTQLVGTDPGTFGLVLKNLIPA